MNFFEEQDKARRKTWLLVTCFGLAVALIALATNAAAFLIASYGGLYPHDLDAWLERPYWIWITAATLLVVGIGSALTSVRLRGGGEAIAAMVGARRVDPGGGELRERRLVNVVEEMAIAAGTPAPAIYVMDEEPGINAFVAGLKPTEAVLVVTAGALESLDRDELQGVVGHEYSHILNGDMRINVRLLGALAGILMIGQMGGFLLRSVRYSRRTRGGARAVPAVLGLGLALLVIGYAGLFSGRLIKAAVSRQREFLADASAVQFTRNPAGIAGALWKIKRHAAGAVLSNAHAEDMSHMCFGQSLRLRFQPWLATHPPLDVRIRRVDPAFAARRLSKRQRARVQAARTGAAAAIPAAAAAAPGPTSAAGVARSVGNPAPEHAAYAARLYAAFSPALLAKVRRPRSAKAVVYALLLAGMDEARLPAARELVAAGDGRNAAAEAGALHAELRRLGPAARLPLLDLAMPALRSLGGTERERHLAVVGNLVRLDRRLTPFEFALEIILRRQLTKSRGRDRVKYYRYDAVLDEIRLLLTVLARAGTRDAEGARAAFQRAMGSFGPRGPEPAADAACSPGALARALEKLAQLSPLLKGPLIAACADCVLHDGRVRAAEGELLRAIALCLDCPVPPLATVDAP